MMIVAQFAAVVHEAEARMAALQLRAHGHNLLLLDRCGSTQLEKVAM